MKVELKTIPTDRVFLRPITVSDQEFIYKGLSHPDVIKYYGVHFESYEATAEQMRWYAEEAQYWWVICMKEGMKLAGAVGLNDVSKVHKKAEIGMWLLPEFWGQGIMQEVMPSICSYGFQELDLNRIEGFIESNNLQCKKAMSKLAFDYEGTMRSCEFKDGQFIDVDIYAKIKEES